MQALTDCDTSGWSELSTAGQMVATDFLAIYTAESDRHLMVNNNPASIPGKSTSAQRLSSPCSTSPAA